MVSVHVHSQSAFGSQNLAALVTRINVVKMLALDVFFQIVFGLDDLVTDCALPEEAARGGHDRPHV